MAPRRKPQRRHGRRRLADDDPVVGGLLGRRRATHRGRASDLFDRHADQYGPLRVDTQPSPLPLPPTSYDPFAALARYDEPWRLQELERSMIWAALCPFVSLPVEDLSQTVLWILGFL